MISAREIVMPKTRREREEPKSALAEDHLCLLSSSVHPLTSKIQAYIYIYIYIDTIFQSNKYKKLETQFSD